MSMKKAWFSRAIFFSWHCSKGDCKFCYMSTHKQNPNKIPRRRMESILAEVILCKKLGWEIGFVSGGCDAYTTIEFEKLLKNIHLVYGKKFWVNIGEIPNKTLKKYSKYIKGVAAAVETVNPKLHDYLCPSKTTRTNRRNA
jgi:biotin synthase-like enzyme